MPNPRTIPHVLTRPTLRFGLEMPLLLLEAILAVAVILLFGASLRLLYSFGGLALLHMTFVDLTSKEPQASRLFARSLRYRAFYPAGKPPWRYR